MELKECTKCHTPKTLSEFDKNCMGKGGLHPNCKLCRQQHEKDKDLLYNEKSKPIPDLPNEIWIPLIEMNRTHMMSNLGRFKSLKRPKVWYDRLLKTYVNKHGYPSINFGIKTFTIHRLLAIYFIPNPLCLPAVNHLDGNKLNYSLSNLEWSTNQDNIIHAHATGLTNPPKGERNGGGGKLTTTQAMEIFESSETLKVLSKRYNVCTDMIFKIKHKIKWKHIHQPVADKALSIEA